MARTSAKKPFSKESSAGSGATSDLGVGRVLGRGCGWVWVDWVGGGGGGEEQCGGRCAPEAVGAGAQAQLLLQEGAAPEF